MMDDRLNETGNCLDLLKEDISIKRGYTCYNVSGTNTKEIDIGIDFGGSELDKIIISVSFNKSSEEIEIPGKENYLKEYGGTYDNKAELTTGTKTYTLNLSAIDIDGRPDSIEITPTIGGSECGKTDTVSKIDDC
jgi:hypothetical protein